MPSSKTMDILVFVESSFIEDSSDPENNQFVFSYKITIENRGDQTVQLLKRKWFISDSNLKVRRVEGDGVVGRKPVLEPGNRHEYVSGCNFETDMGKMRGSYLMERLADGFKFSVEIPEFIMIAPYRFN